MEVKLSIYSDDKSWVTIHTDLWCSYSTDLFESSIFSSLVWQVPGDAIKKLTIHRWTTEKQVLKGTLWEDVCRRIVDLLSWKQQHAWTWASWSMKEMKKEEISIEMIEELWMIAWLAFSSKRGVKNVNKRIKSSEDVILIYVWDNLIWFSCIRYIKWIMYRNWTVLLPQFQWKWIYTNINSYLLKKSPIFFTKTQNLNVIRSFEKSWKEVVIWDKALLELKKRWISKKDLQDFIGMAIEEDWVFKKAYKWYNWDPDRVSHIKPNYYPGFNSADGDSLLIFVK
jgi:hypothetical protein